METARHGEGGGRNSGGVFSGVLCRATERAKHPQSEGQRRLREETVLETELEMRAGEVLHPVGIDSRHGLARRVETRRRNPQRQKRSKTGSAEDFTMPPTAEQKRTKKTKGLKERREQRWLQHLLITAS